jgi:hypothetical protein
VVDLSTGGYATTSDLTAWLAPTAAPSTAVHLLRSASIRVALACQRNPYADSPSMADAAPLRDATCAQAAVWAVSGIDPSDVGVAEAAVKRAALLTGSIEYDTSAQAKAREEAICGLAPEAVAILTAAGLIWLPVPVGDTSGALPTFGLSGPVAQGYGYGQWSIVDAGSWPFV